MFNPGGSFSVRLPFDETTIKKAPLPMFGVYMLFNRNLEVIYIGQGRLFDRLTAHLGGKDNPCLVEAREFVFEPNTRPEDREEELLSLYEAAYGKLPKCNTMRS